MALEVIIEARLDFLDAALDVFVHCGNEGTHVLSCRGLIVIIRVRPNCLAGLQFAEVHVITETGSQGSAGDLIKVVQVAGEKVFPIGIAPLIRHRTKTARVTETSHERTLQYFYRRFHPTMGLIRAKLSGIAGIDDAVFPVNVGSERHPDQDTDKAKTQ